MAPSTQQLLSMYQKMTLVRRFEERAVQAYGMKKIQGFCHLYIGQEAVAVGALEALEPTDFVLTGYRDHGHPLIRGANPGMIMAELFGRSQGYSKGKGGSMHLIDVEHAYYGGYGIVGGQIPLAAGFAFASRYRNDGRVTVCFFGDAAANQGAFLESLNMASKWKLPVIYICENNKYGMGTDISRVSGEPEIHKRAAAFAMKGEAYDGMDAVASFEAVKAAADYCRAGKGPVLLEAMCYRYRGHSMSDAATYRTKDEVEQERKNDPIPKLGDWLVKKKLATQEQLDGFDAGSKKTAEEAIAFAEASPEPSMDELYTDMYVEPGDRDVPPRERALQANDVKWPKWPSEFDVTWDLEPLPKNVTALPTKKGAA